MFNYSLRLQLSPNLDNGERIKNLLDFCEKAKIDDVMFFIGAEDLFIGHPTKIQAKKYVDLIVKLKNILAEKGITVSLNPWTTLGHYDGGRKLQEGQDFSTMVGHDGVKAEVCSCPICETWRKYYVDMLNYYVNEINPETLWLEDDFRLFGKQTGDGVIKLGCFCEEHMKLYRQELGADVTREQFVSRLSHDKKARKAYLDVNRRVMEETIDYLSNGVKNLNRLALMTGGTYFNHGRRDTELYKSLSKGRKKSRNRQALFAYRQISPQNYLSNVNRVSHLIRFFTGDTADCVSEIENFPHGLFVKSMKFDKFQMLSAIPLLFQGATFSIFDFTGNGVIEYDGFAKIYSEVKPLLSKVVGFNLLPANAYGVKVLANQDVAYSVKINGNYADNYSDDTGYMFSVFEGLGVACAYTDDQNIKGETVAISGQVLRSLDKKTIKKLFANNLVIIGGDGVETLFELGLNDLIGAKSYVRLKERDNPHTIEQLRGEDVVCGIMKLRATNHFASGDFIAVEYEKDRKVYSDMLSCYEEKIADCVTKVNNALILPFTPWREAPLPWSLFTKLREYVLKKAIVENAPNGYVTVDQVNVSPYAFSKEGKDYVMLVNASDDDYESITVKTDRQYTDVTLYNVENANGKKVAFVKDGDAYKIDCTLKGLDACVIVCR